MNSVPFSRAIRRAIFACVLIFVVLCELFLSGAPFRQSGIFMGSLANTNAPINRDAFSSSARGNFSSITREPSLTDNNRLTGGLRPGRGVPIPNAADVHELPVEDVSFYNGRGELLSGWLSLTSPASPVIILTHGTPGNRVSMISRAVFLHKHGFNVLFFDFQSYGKSQGVMSTLGMVESEDILAAISFLHSVPTTKLSKIAVLGLSMGATAAVLAASRSEDILALVAESCPVDATRVTADVPNEASRQADKQLVEEVYGVDITQARPIDAVNKLAGHTAIFFINGDADTITPLAGMQALYSIAGNPKLYWIVPGAQHAQSFTIDPEDYIERVDAFFDWYLR